MMKGSCGRTMGPEIGCVQSVPDHPDRAAWEYHPENLDIKSVEDCLRADGMRKQSSRCMSLTSPHMELDLLFAEGTRAHLK